MAAPIKLKIYGTLINRVNNAIVDIESNNMILFLGLFV